MKRIGQVALIPFWMVGAVTAVLVLLVLAVVMATRAGYRDVKTWTERDRTHE